LLQIVNESYLIVVKPANTIRFFRESIVSEKQNNILSILCVA